MRGAMRLALGGWRWETGDETGAGRLALGDRR